jgi:hypothetical protein
LDHVQVKQVEEFTPLLSWVIQRREMRVCDVYCYGPFRTNVDLKVTIDLWLFMCFNISFFSEFTGTLSFTPFTVGEVDIVGKAALVL